MPRSSRIFLGNVALHIIQRGNNRNACFLAKEDYGRYLSCLRTAACQADCAVHAYVLMTNHVHLLLSPAHAAAVPAMMRSVAQKHAQYINWRYRRTGTLWEGRYRAALIQNDTHLLVCQRYVELNPVRARMVQYPGQYPWSSYRCNAEGRANAIVVAHSTYLELGTDSTVRQTAYRRLFDEPLAESQLQHIRITTNNNFAVGDQEFLRSVSKGR